AAGDEPVPPAHLPDRVEKAEPELHGAVELPAELAHVGDAEREARDGAYRDLLRAHVAEGDIAEVGVGQRLEDLPRGRAPETEAREARGDVLDTRAAVLRELAPDPGGIVVAESRARDDAEAVLGEARDREVAFDPAPRVEHLRMGNTPDRAGDS